MHDESSQIIIGQHVQKLQLKAMTIRGSIDYMVGCISIFSEKLLDGKEFSVPQKNVNN